MTKNEKMQMIENPAESLMMLLAQMARIRTRVQIINKSIRSEDKSGEYELATDELEAAIDAMYKAESALGDALKYQIIAAGTELA